MRLVKFALPVLFLAGLALLLARAWTETEDKAARALALEHARSQFLARAAVVRAAPDELKYHAELRQLLRAWFAEQTDLGNRWPQLRGEPAPFTAPAPRARTGDLKEFQELADGAIGAWREGKLELLQSTAAGGLRVDLIKVAKLAAPQPHLAVDLAVWGAPEEVELDEAAGGKQTLKATVPLTFRGLSLRFFDKDGKLVAEMPGEGEPSLRLDLPGRLVHDAPPGVVLARYEPGLFPREAAEVEWTLAAQLKTASGDSRPAVATWKGKLDPSWAVGANEVWGGKDRTMTEEEAGPKKAASPGAKGAARAGSSGDEPARPAQWPARADASQ